MKATKITEKVYWVGAIDWGIRDMHGYATSSGTTYNAFLIMGEKITLIDTVKKQFQKTLLDRISSVIDPSKIDYIVSNHAELDHSGCLPEIIDIVKPEKVFASPMGIKTLEAHFHASLPITPVKSGDEVDLGGLTISFIETKMLHWPDSMFTYLKEEEVLFSQDAFGMHLATGNIFDEGTPEYILEWEAEKYFANILMPFAPKILALLENVEKMNLPIKILATDHGPIWRKHIPMILDLYKKWSTRTPMPKAVVLFDSMWGATAKMADAITEGIRDAGIEVKQLSMSSTHRSDVASEILNASAIVAGSSTLNNNVFPSMADVLTYIKGLKPLNLIIGASFGSYGWSGESVKQVNEYLTAMNVDLISDGIRVKYMPSEDDLQLCYNLGTDIANKLK